jgi:RNA polymerase subunit RPABC4/transcription elongation factor Spt4
MAAAKCECGCGQAPYRSARNRKASCPDCGYVIRVTREWIGAGLPTCVCGGPLELPCLFDQSYLPGTDGAEAWRALEGKRIVHEQLSANARKAARGRRRCKMDRCSKWTGKGELYCPVHASHDLPF